MALDDDRDRTGVCPIVRLADELPKVNRYVYRVSWIIGTKRTERLFESRLWAEKFVSKLREAAELLNIQVDPMIGDVPVEDGL